MPANPHGYWLAALICLGSLSTNAFSQLPAAKMQGAVSYLSGGIGDDEEIQIRGAAKEYGVLLEFAEVERGTSHGRWTSDVSVTVKSGANAVLSTTTDGPLMLVKLKPGSYVIDAERQGVKQTKRIEVNANAVARERFFWIVDAALAPR